MARPIKLTEGLKRKAVEEFKKTLDGIKMSDGSVVYNKSFTYDKEAVGKATILFTPDAYAKMIALIMKFSSEVAWHGVGERIDGSTYRIRDIVVYPQTVSGADVDMDQEEYTKWLLKNCKDERFGHLIMQGHSHVNMGTTPSSVDKKHQTDILSQLNDDMYYIFMIWNKRLEHYSLIFDLSNNILFENDDIEYSVEGEDESVDAFLLEADSLVKTRSVAPIVSTTTYDGKTYDYKSKTDKKYGGKYKGGIDTESDYYARYSGYYSRYDSF